jgi:hypothetical protein
VKRIDDLLDKIESDDLVIEVDWLRASGSIFLAEGLSIFASERLVRPFELIRRTSTLPIMNEIITIPRRIVFIASSALIGINISDQA